MPLCVSNMFMRPPGAPAGAAPVSPWYVNVFCDSYERINVWTHAMTCVFMMRLLVWSVFASDKVIGGYKNAIEALRLYCVCAIVTQGLSALTHTWPDLIWLEKLDHVGIVFMLVGTPWTAMRAHGWPCEIFKVYGVLGIVCALAPPLPRVLGFLAMGAGMSWVCRRAMNVILGLEVALIFTSALLFLRGRGHELSCVGLADHHVLHYCVTMASMLHVVYIGCVPKK